MSYQGYQQLLVEQQGKLLVVKFNNPKKKNCINRFTYQEMTRVLTEVNDDEGVNLVVFTGVGDIFTAGNDLSQSSQSDDIDAFFKQSNATFKAMVLSFVNCKKIVFSLVNGPAIGIGATIVGLCDVAWCSETAYFYTPFTKLGLVPEGGSSYMLPLILGRSKASETLLLNEPLSAQEAYQFNFVSRIFKASELDSVIWPKLRQYSELPTNSLLQGKRLIKEGFVENLIKANESECKQLLQQFQHPEFFQAIMDFASRKAKAKL
ncbi:enoyl-CoA delta isomerase 2 [Drosophila takahashii]|uniref:enoyl-CoA delta isomerase 2 n=1 Tax=Drosophila takahashii TaxID=29030 RepID=UPI001CF87203|nr:enoyl-CoA delta isomerase 2 [Drosophila takahashii]